MFSVLTFNLRFGLADDGLHSWPFRRKAFPELFAAHRTDFICLQEANDFQSDYIADLLPEYAYIGQRTPAPPYWQNNLIFYKKEWQCVQKEHFYLSATPTIPSAFPASRWPRQCTLGTFARGTVRLICINTHFDFDVVVRVKSARLIMERLSLLPEDIPAVLTGDFNAVPFSPCYRIFTGFDPCPVHGTAVFKNAFDKPFPGTHHGFSGRVDGNHIDWILYRGDILPQWAGVIRETFAGMYPSDHFPVAAVFRL